MTRAATIRCGRRHRNEARPARQRGGLLLDALVAAMAFALGAVALVGFEAQAVRHLQGAQARADALRLAQATLAVMHASDNAALYAQYDMRADGPGYRQLASTATRLPGVAAGQNAPEVTVSAGPSGASRTARVVLRWQLPGEHDVHRYVATAVVGGR